MGYHIPSDKQVINALKRIFAKNHTVRSQRELKELTEKELSTKKKQYGVSGKRLRKLAVQSSFISLEIHSHEGDPQKILTKCPVCGMTLNRVKNLTIWGGEVTIEFLCPRCKYWTGKRKRVPSRYVFHSKK